MIVTRFAPSPTGLSPSRPRPLGAGRGGARRARPAGGSCCASRTSTAPAAAPEFDAAILEDLAWLGLDLGRPGAAAIRAFRRLPRARSTGSTARGCSIPAFAPAGTSRPRSPAPAARRKARPGRLSRHLPPALRGGARRTASHPGIDYALRLDLAARAARAPARSTGRKEGAASPAEPQLLGDVVLARKDVPAAITSRSPSTTRCKA